MQRRTAIFLGFSSLIGGSALFAKSLRDGDMSIAGNTHRQTKTTPRLTMLDANPTSIEPFKLSDAEWRERLSPEAYAVLRKDGTERPFTSPLNDEKRDGQYVCAGCGLALFEQEQKFDSGTGWPSFFDTIEGRVETKIDFKMILPRTEYHCARCGGHQGHVFKDGPQPTGLRYCNNGVALDFVPANQG
jgi:peptide-methionine (R)-S-oxide reductase